MLKITRLKIQGFRSLSSIDLPLEAFTLLIGRNNAGKSNTLLAIKLLLEASLGSFCQSGNGRGRLSGRADDHGGCHEPLRLER
jgi:predicted ATPase